MITRKQRIEPWQKLKVQIRPKGRSIPSLISEAAEKLNEFAGPMLQQIEASEGIPPTKKARLRGSNVTKQGILNLWYEVRIKA